MSQVAQMQTENKPADLLQVCRHNKTQERSVAEVADRGVATAENFLWRWAFTMGVVCLLVG